MPSKELIEKVARAIATADERNGAPPYEIVIANKHSKEALFDQAEAAISTILAALQEPTEGMLDEAEGLNDYSNGVVWRAMLNASALGEQSK